MNKTLFRLVLYLMPAIADCVTGIFYFIGPVRATQLGYDPLVAGSMVTVRAAIVCLSGFVFSRFLTSRNTVFSMFLSIAGVFGVCMLGLFATNLTMLYLTSALSGIFLVVFACAYQIFVKAIDTDERKPLARVAGSYTLAWSVGMSFGPMITGALMALAAPAVGGGPSLGWMYTYLAGATLIAINLFCFLWVRKHSAEAMRRHLRAEEEGVREEASGKPDLAWLGWIMAVVGTTALGIVNGVFPAGATGAGMPEWESGLIMMTQGVAMGVFAYFASMLKDGLYSGRGVFATGIMGSVGLFLFILPRYMGWGILDSMWPFFLAALLFGSYCGVIYLYSSFHSLVHPKRATRNIGVCEGFLASGIIIGSLCGGWLAKTYDFYLPFGIGAVLLIILACFQFGVHKRYARAAVRHGGSRRISPSD